VPIRIGNKKQKNPSDLQRPPLTHTGRPFGRATTPFNPATGKYLPFVPDAVAAGGASAIAFIIVEEFDDYLECTDPDGETVNVAKPYLLRKEPFDGLSVDYDNPQSTQSVTYTYDNDYVDRREADDGTSTETQRVTPEYYVGEEILGISCEVELTNADLTCAYVDLNTGGRCWAAL
jgi:hypothetical protein